MTTSEYDLNGNGKIDPEERETVFDGADRARGHLRRPARAAP